MDTALPLFAQLKETIIGAIEQGDFGPGDQLPSQRELCHQYGMSHMTVRRAINELVNEGVIRAVPGKGLYVAEKTQFVDTNSLKGFEEQMAGLGVKATTKMLDFGIVNASKTIASTLGLEVGTPLVYISRLRLADGKPLSITDAYLPHLLCPGVLDQDLAENSLFVTLRTQYGLNLASSSSTVGAVLANKEQAALLNLALPAALLYREQVTYLDNDQAIELSRTFLRGDCHYIQMNEGTPPAEPTPVTAEQFNRTNGWEQ
jgi:GntR family transcriptional regulator